jgi:hypothetical protein
MVLLTLQGNGTLFLQLQWSTMVWQVMDPFFSHHILHTLWMDGLALYTIAPMVCSPQDK